MSTDLQTRISESRRAGSVRVGQILRPPGDPAVAADAAAITMAATPIGEAWAPVDQAKAREIVQSAIAFDLAYKVRCMPDAQAARLAEEFFSLVPSPTHIVANLQNTRWVSSGPGADLASHGFTPVTEATFGIAVVSDGAKEAAILIVEDED